MITGFTNYIYPQKNCIFNFFWDNPQNNWSGNFQIIGTDNDTLNIKFISGKIFDNNNFIYSFQPQTFIDISGNYSENYFNIFLNNQFIYSKTGSFGKASGLSFNWTTGYSWDNVALFPKTFFYGELPVIDFIYEPSGFSSDEMQITLSGNQNNNGPFILYSGEIGRYSNFNNNIQSFYFEISGVNDWATGITINKNEIFNFNITPVEERLPFINTYVPLILHTNAGIIGRNLFVSRLRKPPAQELVLNINPSTSISNINSLLRSSFIFDLIFKNTEKETKDAVIIIRDYEANNIDKDGYKDSFPESWSLTIDGENIEFSNVTIPVTGFISGYLSGGNFYAFSQNYYPSGLSGFSGIYIQDNTTQALYFPSGEYFDGFNYFVGEYFNLKSGFAYSGFNSGYSQYGSGFYPTEGLVTGSMTGIIGSRNIGGVFSGKMNIQPNIFEQNKKIEVYKQIEQPDGNIGFTGSAIYSISGNNFYKTGIIGSNLNIFRQYYSYSV